MASNGITLDDVTNRDILNDSSAISDFFDYYGLDDVSSAPDVYPDPDIIFDSDKKLQLIELSNEKLAGVKNSNETTNKQNAISLIPPKKASTFVEKIHSQSMDIENGGQSIQRIRDYNSKRQQTFHLGEDIHNEDLREHDIIDNIMYIYYGSNVALRKSLGSNIIIVGTVFALAAQILAIVFTLLRNRYERR